MYVFGRFYQATPAFFANDGFTVSDLFGEGWFKAFNVFNFYGVTSVIMAVEILLLNSIKRPFVSRST